MMRPSMRCPPRPSRASRSELQGAAVEQRVGYVGTESLGDRLAGEVEHRQPPDPMGVGRNERDRALAEEPPRDRSAVWP